jgi:hypothetical protein
MKSKVLLMLAAMLLAAPALGAQDLLIRNSGEETEVKVLEVSRDYVKYRKFSNPDGPVFTVPVSEIFMIRYEDGTKTVFGDGSYNTGSGISDMSTPETAQPVKLERVLRPTRMQIGAMVRPAAFSLLTMNENVVDGVSYYNDAIRYSASFGAVFDYWLSDEVQKKWYLEAKLLYSLMGGKTSTEIYNLDYITLDAGIGKRGNIAFWTFYMGIGILTNAKYADVQSKDTKLNIYEWCNPLTYRLGSDFGFCIGKYIDLGLYFDFTVSNLVKPIFFNGRNDNWNWCVGLTFCYRFDIAKKH